MIHKIDWNALNEKVTGMPYEYAFEEIFTVLNTLVDEINEAVDLLNKEVK